MIPSFKAQIQSGHVVGFPTETVYGLGADAFNKEAVESIYKIKKRPFDKPMSIHIADREQLNDLVKEISPEAQELIDKHWPGPVTLIFKKSDKVPLWVTRGLDTIGIRLPDHDLCREFIRGTGTVIVGTSANISGEDPCINASTTQKLFPQLMVLDGGSCREGRASKIIDCSQKEKTVLRD